MTYFSFQQQEDSLGKSEIVGFPILLLVDIGYTECPGIIELFLIYRFLA